MAEIGLCKIARFVRSHPEGKAVALLLQRQVFMDQMRLAAKLKRPVSVHCVQQHGPFMSVLKELVQEALDDLEIENGDQKSDENREAHLCQAFPTAIGMHSFTGTAHHVKEILKFEQTWFPNHGGLFYFGFSHSVNVAMCSSTKSKKQGREAVQAVPIHQLVAESDVHAAKDVAAGTAGAVAYIASALDRPLIEIAKVTASNGLCFLHTVKK